MARKPRCKTPTDHDPDGLREALRKAALTQRDLADQVDISESHISEILRGTRNAPPILIIKLAAALKCKREDIERKEVPA